jgi:hypothetical protein
MESTISSTARVSTSATLVGASLLGLGAAGVSLPEPPGTRLTPLQEDVRSLSTRYKTKKTFNKYENTYVGAFFNGSFFGADSLGRDPMTSALLPPAPFSPRVAPLPLELPAGAVIFGGIVWVPFDVSTGVEGTFDPTLASSPYAEVRASLSAGLKKSKTA